MAVLEVAQSGGKFSETAVRGLSGPLGIDREVNIGFCLSGQLLGLKIGIR